MDAGKLDRKIVLMPPTVSQSDTGAETVNYQEQNWITVWANRKDEMSGNSEQSESNRLTAVWSISWLIRYSIAVKNINHTWLVKGDDGEMYDIQHIAYIGRKQQIAIKTKRHD